MPFFLSVLPTWNGVQQVYRLDREMKVRIGRHVDAELQLHDLAVSRWHCLLQVQDRRAWIRDTNSRNGTWCGTTPIMQRLEPYEVRPGETVRLGPAQLTLLQTPGITRGQWQSCSQPLRLLQYLPLRGSQRKLRLFACGCCRLMGKRLVDPRSLDAIQLAEDLADGRASLVQMEEARRKAGAAVGATSGEEALVAQAAAFTGEMLARQAAHLTWETLEYSGLGADLACELARDLLYEFFNPILIPEDALHWREGTVVRIARDLYQRRTFDELPVLADALEDAGCVSEEVLEHCRTPRLHTRGCWVLDAILFPGPQT